MLMPFLPQWPTCNHHDGQGEPCTGVRVGESDRCWAHLDDPEFEEALGRLRPRSDLDVRGTTLAEDLMHTLVNALRDYERPGDSPVFGTAHFDRAQIQGGC
jgi:hypothetical protein